ncbi:MAG: hypothetical protein ACFE89_01260 [Candidatus Hodarchaeota archaeon]
MSAKQNKKARICPIPPKPRISPPSVVKVDARLRWHLNPFLLKKVGAILIFFGAVLIFVAQVWISAICAQFVSILGFDLILARNIVNPMIVAMSFGILSGSMVLIGAILMYFKNVKIGTSLAIFWALLANLMLALILLLRTEIHEYVFYIPFWQTFAPGIIGSIVGVLGGRIGLASLRTPQAISPEGVVKTSQLRTAGWALSLLGAGIIVFIQLLLLFWYLENTIFNPFYPYGMDSFALSNLSIIKIGIFVTLIGGIGLLSTLLIISNLYAKLGDVLVFIFTIPAILPFYWGTIQPLLFILIQGTGAGLAIGGSILSLSAALYLHKIPQAQPIVNP